MDSEQKSGAFEYLELPEGYKMPMSKEEWDVREHMKNEAGARLAEVLVMLNFMHVPCDEIQPYVAKFYEEAQIAATEPNEIFNRWNAVNEFLAGTRDGADGTLPGAQAL